MESRPLHPQPPPGEGWWRALREGLREFGQALVTPSAPGAPPLSGARRQWVRAVPYLVALGFVASLLPVTVTVLVQDYGVNGVTAGALATAQTAPLLLALTRPLPAWWVIFTADVLGAVALMAAPGTEGRSWPWTPMVVVGYPLLMVLLGLRESRRTLTAVWLATGAAGLAFEAAGRERGDGIHLLLFVLSGVTLVLTYALRSRGEARQRLAEQETISEAERSRRTLLEERARIARELHDVVAHHMSVITVQADSAPYRVQGLPPEAVEEFGSIAAAARESLAEMRRLLVVLRNEDSGGELAPQPGLDKLQQLVEATVRAGVPARLSLAADVGEVGQAVGLSAYRIVQEALSNVVRHAPGAPTTVLVRGDGADLTVLVVNGPAAEPVTPLEHGGTGHGLIGMRERVRLTGGTLDVGPLPDGGFRVAARIPLRPDPADGPGDPGDPGHPGGPDDPGAPGDPGNPRDRDLPKGSS
ncbi:sensor histidine kinase [Streptomyces sp. NPDC002644]